MSQLDLDQGGTVRQWVRKYLGPSVGWVLSPDNNVLPVIAAGTVTALVGTTLITVAVDDDGTTIVLPAASNPAAGPQAVPGPFVNSPITIVDVGGFAGDHPITIQPAAGETIMGLASITISVAFGGWVLVPDPANATWTTV